MRAIDRRERVVLSAGAIDQLVQRQYRRVVPRAAIDAEVFGLQTMTRGFASPKKYLSSARW